MKLSTYIRMQHGRGAGLAAQIGVPQSLISQWSTEVRQVPAERCPEIERATGGKVRCEDLRPDVAWHILRKSN
jgi:DNA-binding transcriptional regulator YdaS (Cro superfamily)